MKKIILTAEEVSIAICKHAESRGLVFPKIRGVTLVVDYKVTDYELESVTVSVVEKDPS